VERFFAAKGPVCLKAKLLLEDGEQDVGDVFGDVELVGGRHDVLRFAALGRVMRKPPTDQRSQETLRLAVLSSNGYQSEAVT